ncbi:hypothetical protein ACFSJY_18680 [Thalassotalea euphylliae]|uniref:hypothetical protein n=1 Tax=Thalassotalea euphylliae TaxID=1655234 RepID=UPI00363A1A40
MRLAFALISIFLLSSCSGEAEKYLDFKNAFKFSDDVGHFKFIETIDWEVNGKQCNWPIRKYEVIESFKGSLKAGDTIELHGDVDSYKNMEKERILFIRKTTREDTFSTEECDIKMFTDFKGISLSCCTVEIDAKTNKKMVLFFEMINSEQRGPDIPVALESVYETLRKYGD